MKHSIIAPSSAGIWGKPDGCTGYVAMAASYPEAEDSQHAREGTAAHELGEILIALGIESHPETVTPDIRKNYVNKPAANGEIFTGEMFDGAWDYASDVLREFRARPNATTFSEYGVKAKSVHSESFGTVDQVMYDPDAQELIIWDYKFGHGIVEAFENWQCINYVAGIFDEFKLEDQYTTVRIRIVQPRAFHPEGIIREWATNGAELRGHINTLHNNAHKALGPEASTLTGSHCRYCEALHACPAALEAGMKLYEVAGQPLPVELSDQALGLQLSMVKRAREHLEYLESAYTEQVKSKLRGGSNIPGWGVEPKLGRVKWSKPIDEVIALGDILGKDLRRPLDAITPSQAIKLGVDKTVVDAYSERPTTGLELKQINTKKSREVFSK